jgi:hypothetical protein
VVELVDTGDLKSPARKGVGVRLPSWAPLQRKGGALKLLTEEETDLVIQQLITKLRGGRTMFKKLHDANGHVLLVKAEEVTAIGTDVSGKNTFVALNGNTTGFIISETAEEAVKILES